MRNSGKIHVLFYLQREKVHFSLRISCDMNYWNKEKMRVKSGDPNAQDKNLIIENTLSRINDIVVKYRLRNRVLTKKLFLKAYHRPDDFDTFFDFCKDYQRKNLFRTREIATIKSHNSALKKLKEYAPELHFDDMDRNFWEKYYTYLKREKQNNNNTAHKNFEIIDSYLNMALKEGYIEENTLDDFHIQKTKPNIVYLEDYELQKFVELYYNDNYDSKYKSTLQFFLFMCFGSQHVGDAKKMRIEDFRGDSFIYFRMKNRNKKPEPVTVPISSILRRLIIDISGGRLQGLLFEKLPTEQTMNRYLKVIANQLDIDKDVSHKTGRHTFATFFLSQTMDINSLKDILGHSKIEMTLLYAHALEKNKQRGITCFDVFNI